MSAGVVTPTVNQLAPPSTVRARIPLFPPASASWEFVARRFSNPWPEILPPTGAHVEPPLFETTVAPLSPTATARVADAKAAAKIFSVDGLTKLPWLPLSVVRTSCPPPGSVIRQVLAPAQPIDASAGAPETPVRLLGAQCAPPSTLLSSVRPSPTAYPAPPAKSRPLSPLTCVPGPFAALATSTQELPPSVVLKILPCPWPRVVTTPV